MMTVLRQELLVQAGVSIQKISFTKPETNKTTFANFKELERNLSALVFKPLSSDF